LNFIDEMEERAKQLIFVVNDDSKMEEEVLNMLI
jgi:phosphotransferase system IIB component